MSQRLSTTYCSSTYASSPKNISESIKKKNRPGNRNPGFPGELRQLFSNLILNALDALDEGGRLTLHVARSRDWSSHGIGARRSGVRITIADNGSSIPDAD